MEEIIHTVLNQDFIDVLINKKVRQRQFVVAQVDQDHLVVQIRQKTAQRVGKGIPDNQEISPLRSAARQVFDAHQRVVSVQKYRIFILLLKALRIEYAVVNPIRFIADLDQLSGIPQFQMVWP